MFNRLGTKVFGAGAAVAIAAVFALAAPNTAHAQAQFGPQVTYLVPDAGDSEFGAGARVQYMIPNAKGFGLAGEFNNYFVEGADVFDIWEFNANGVFAFATDGPVTPHLAAGLNYRKNPVTNFQGLNVEGGFQFGTNGGVTPFVTGRYTTTSNGSFNITGGILF